MNFFRSLGVYFGVSEETEEDRLHRERGDAQLRAFTLPRIALNAALMLVLGTLGVGLLECLLWNSRPVTVANLIDEGLPAALIATAGILLRDFYVRREVRKTSGDVARRHV